MMGCLASLIAVGMLYLPFAVFFRDEIHDGNGGGGSSVQHVCHRKDLSKHVVLFPVYAILASHSVLS